MKLHDKLLSAAFAAAFLPGAASMPMLAKAPADGGLTAPSAWMVRAREMQKAENYAGVIDQITRLLSSGEALAASETEECRFLLAKAKYERGDEDCLRLLQDFVSEYPASFHTPVARLLMADFYYFDGDFGLAAESYLDAGIDNLDAKSRSLYRFRMGVSLIKCGRFKDASRIFEKLRENADYRVRSDFYLAYIDYAQKNYDRAYDAFWQLEGKLPQAPASPAGRNAMRRKEPYQPTGFEAGYYMTQIDFIRGEYEKAAEQGRSLLQRIPVEELVPEINRVVGESYFKLGEPEVAEGFLENYIESCRRDEIVPEPSAVYDLGAISYSHADYNRAEKLFSEIADEHNAIGQGAWLYLGQCAVERGDDSAAAMSFEKASQMAFDSAVSEAALYNYVASRTHGGKIPFSSAITLFERFLDQYPASRYASSVRESLASAYFHEKNYSDAMRSIEAIKNPSAKVLEAKQKVAYELGIENLANGDPAEAAKYMRMAAQLKKYDAAIGRQAELWLGDALYAQNDFKGASEAYTRFLSSASKDSNRTLALYDLGYAQYMQKQYAAATKNFRSAIQATPKLPAPLLTDATIRLADCLYYSGDTRSAIDSYSAAIDAGATDGDYALLRRAMMHGINGDLKAKIADLAALPKNYPGSRWIPQSMLESGLAYAELGDVGRAEDALLSLAERYQSSPEARKGMLNLAIIYADNGNSEKAITAYKAVVSEWPTSEEASLAGDDLRSIYARRGELPQLAAFLKSVPGAPQLDNDEIERLAYDAAARSFSSDGSLRRLEDYLKDYPDGRYLAAALADIAEGRLEKGDSQGALEAAERLLASRPDSPQAPAALLVKARVLESHDSGRKTDALEAYRSLAMRGGADYAADAYLGIARTTQSPAEQLEYARKAQSLGGLEADATEEARLFEAIALGKLQKRSEADAILRDLAANPASEAGARAAVELGQSLLDRRQLKEAEKLLSSFTDTGTPHQYWLARGFIALADVYRAQGRTSLAREYVSSLRDNYPGRESDIRDMINQRLNNWKK